jgi:hypothetical protein
MEPLFSNSSGFVDVLPVMTEPFATHDFADGELDAAVTFFRRTRNELRTLRLVRVSTEWVRLFDANGDYFELRGIGYSDAEIVSVLKTFNTPFNPSIHLPIHGPYEEFTTGRRCPWAADRVM